MLCQSLPHYINGMVFEPIAQLFYVIATSGEDFTQFLTFLTVSSNQPTCTNLSILNDDILEGCEAFFVAFEVDPNFSGVAAIPRDEDKSIVVIVDDLADGNCMQNQVYWV